MEGGGGTNYDASHLLARAAGGSGDSAPVCTLITCADYSPLLPFNSSMTLGCSSR